MLDDANQLTEAEFDWFNHCESAAIHECGHALVAHVLGSDVIAVAYGPTALDELELAGYCEHDRPKLSPFDRLVVSVAGEVAVSAHTGAKPDFAGDGLGGDLQRISELVDEYYGVSMRDPVNTEYCQRAIKEAKNILGRWSLALTCLVRKLRRQFKLTAEQFRQTVDRCGVVRQQF
jgi:hypothetical protein